mmetsp:Transcript_34910/g.34580  ORF Transcript_34910/g.34580 Transcript_34910/m.34580 type:complete len:204 (-) Transcript_34910:14-625(-)
MKQDKLESRCSKSWTTCKLSSVIQVPVKNESSNNFGSISSKNVGGGLVITGSYQGIFRFYSSSSATKANRRVFTHGSSKLRWLQVNQDGSSVLATEDDQVFIQDCSNYQRCIQIKPKITSEIITKSIFASNLGKNTVLSAAGKDLFMTQIDASSQVSRPVSLKKQLEGHIVDIAEAKSVFKHLVVLHNSKISVIQLEAKDFQE